MIETYISELGMWIAYTGVAVVLLGVIVTLVRLLIFLFTGLNDERAALLRHSLMIYLSLGLDFLIAKDVIVTLSLEQGDYEGLIQLGVIILIRILLSFFVHFEEKEINVARLKSKAKKALSKPVKKKKRK